MNITDSDIKKVLLTHIFGDGKFPICIFPLSSVPDFYVVRIDSKYKVPKSHFNDICPASLTEFMQEFDDEVFSEIIYEFGSTDDSECLACGECSRCVFPVLSDTDCTYRAADAEDLDGLDMTRNIPFCVVATSRFDNVRRCISGKCSSKQTAEIELERLNREMKKTHKFFKIARFPFAPSIGGTGGRKVKR